MAVPKFMSSFPSVLYALEDGKTKHVKEIREYALDFAFEGIGRRQKGIAAQ